MDSSLFFPPSSLALLPSSVALRNLTRNKREAAGLTHERMGGYGDELAGRLYGKTECRVMEGEDDGTGSSGENILERVLISFSMKV